MSRYSKSEQERLMQDVFEPERVMLVCGKHQYAAGGFKSPILGCKDCLTAFYTHLVGSVPPHLRQQRLEELEGIIYHMVEGLAHGEIPFIPLMPESKFEKDAIPD